MPLFPRGSAFFCALLLSVALLAGCGGSGEMLVPVRGAVPENVDLSGEWRMQNDVAAMERSLTDAIRRTDGIDEGELMQNIMQQNRSSRRRADVGGLVHVFLQTGERLRITQTDAGLFIAFDRSVVEEYRFGEARVVNKGGAVAQRVSGWDGSNYVIETLDKEGMKLTERYALDADALSREIVLRSNEMEEVQVTQSFSRIN